MRILQVIPQLTEAGAEVFIVDLSNELVKNNEVKLVVFYNNAPSDFLYKKLNPKIEVVYLGKKLGFDYKIITKLKNQFKTFKPDIIHTHLGALTYIIPLMRHFAKTSVFHTIHNDASKEAGTMLRLLRFYYFKYKKIIPVTISDKSESSYKKAYKGIDSVQINNGRSKIFPSDMSNHVAKEIEEIKENNTYKVIVNIGRLSKQKNQLLLIDAIKDLNQTGIKIKLLIIGGKRSGDEILYNQILKNASNNIKILGVKKNATDYLYYADGFCLSSTYEGLPISLLEAIAVGCIPICTPAGGIPQIIKSSEYGYLAKGFSKENLKAEILNWYNDIDNNHKEISTNIKSLYSSEYSIESCAENYLDAFKKEYKNQ